MIVSKTVNVFICSSNISKYKNLGYNVTSGEYCEIFIEDLAKGSNYFVTVECDYCGKIFEERYNDYNKHIKFVKKCSCKDCSYLKHKDVIISKYGVDNVCYLDDIINKKKETNLRKYGVEYSVMSEEVLNKRYETNIKKYGCKYPIATEKVQNKIIKNNQDKYNSNYPFQNKEYLDNINNISFEKYGTRLFTNNISKPQRQICIFFEGEINYYINGYYLDVFLPKYNIDLEYDGGGHTLSIKLGKMSEEEFYKRQLTREEVIINSGIKIIRIVNPTDIKINNNNLEMIEYTILNFDNTYSICEYYINNNNIKYR